MQLLVYAVLVAVCAVSYGAPTGNWDGVDANVDTEKPIAVTRRIGILPYYPPKTPDLSHLKYVDKAPDYTEGGKYIYLVRFQLRFGIIKEEGKPVILTYRTSKRELVDNQKELEAIFGKNSTFLSPIDNVSIGEYRGEVILPEKQSTGVYDIRENNDHHKADEIPADHKPSNLEPKSEIPEDTEAFQPKETVGDTTTA